jgi:hypothetical protein
VDTTSRQNTIGDNDYDRIDILDASQDNLLDGNQIESQEGPSSTGVLLQGSGSLFPLGNTLSDNEIRRNRVDVLISGARATRFVGNSITAIGERTAVLLAIGNASGLGGSRFGQPSGTIFRSNKLYEDGVCTGLRGCAVRLLPGVTTSIDATQNDFGVSDAVDIQAAIWDHGRDAELGTVVFSGQLGQAATPPPRPTAAPFAPPVRPNSTAVALVPSPPVPALAPVVTPAPVMATATPTPAGTGTGGATVPVAFIDPGTGEYYVELSLCVTDAAGQPVAADLLAVSFVDGAGTPRGVAHAAADGLDCFTGDLQPSGAGANVQPAMVVITDNSGASTNLNVLLGAPLVRPPRNALP